MTSKWNFWRDWIFLIGFLCRSNSLETKSFLLCAGLRQMASGSQRLGVGFPPVKRLTSRCRFTPSSPVQLLGSRLPLLLSQLPDVPWPHLLVLGFPFPNPSCLLSACSQSPFPPWLFLANNYICQFCLFVPKAAGLVVLCNSQYVHKKLFWKK